MEPHESHESDRVLKPKKVGLVLVWRSKTHHLFHQFEYLDFLEKASIPFLCIYPSTSIWGILPNPFYPNLDISSLPGKSTCQNAFSNASRDHGRHQRKPCFSHVPLSIPGFVDTETLLGICTSSQSPQFQHLLPPLQEAQCKNHVPAIGGSFDFWHDITSGPSQDLLISYL